MFSMKALFANGGHGERAAVWTGVQGRSPPPRTLIRTPIRPRVLSALCLVLPL